MAWNPKTKRPVKKVITEGLFEYIKNTNPGKVFKTYLCLPSTKGTDVKEALRQGVIDKNTKIIDEANLVCDWVIKFINTCEAMIHARIEGESFGLSCAEFSIRNKPIITWNGSPDRNHIEVLGEKGIYYSTPQELKDILLSFDKQQDKDWNAYRCFNPHDAMKTFDEVFLK